MIEAEQITDGDAREGASLQSDVQPARVLTVQPAEASLAPRDLMVIEVLDRMERLYRDQLSGRDRELSLKDRLLSEYERRAERAEQQISALQSYISNLPPDASTKGDTSDRAWWRFWK